MKLKKLIHYFVMLTLGLTFFSLPSDIFADNIKTSIMKENFNNCDNTDGFANTLTNTGMSYIGGNSKLKVVTGSEAINGKSVLSENCDFRWWLINKYDKKMYLGGTFIFTTPGEIELVMGISTQSPKNTNEITEGTLFEVLDKDGVPVVKDQKGKVIATLSYNEKYSIQAEITRGQQEYVIKINGEEMPKKATHCDKIFIVNAIRLSHTKGSVIMDDLYYNMDGTTYPQLYSTLKAPAEMPPLVTETSADYSATNVYFNGQKNPIIVGKNGADIKFRLGDFLEATGANYAGPVKSSKKVSLSDIENMFDAKIWYDKTTNSVLITTGQYKNDGILRVFRGKMYMNGEPYYDFSFNKFDLLWQIYASVTKTYTKDYPDDSWGIERAEESLSQLHDYGFRSIRVFVSEGGAETVFDEEKKHGFFDSVEKMFELCNKYEIKVVVCMNLIDSKFLDCENVDGLWIPNDETYLDLVAKPESESRKVLKTYLQEFIGKFKDNDAVLMWEINNEGNLSADLGQLGGNVCYSILQLGEFYGWCADVIKEVDSVHALTTGDSMIRTSQWHLQEAIAQEKYTVDWTADTAVQRRSLIAYLNEKYDAVSMHTYDSGLNGEKGLIDSGESIAMTPEEYMKDCAIVGKALYIGETNVSTGITDRLTDQNTVEIYKDFIQTYVDAGVQLTHWWAFHTDRKSQYDTDLTIGVRPGNEIHEQVLELFRDANAQLQSKYMVNGYNYSTSGTSHSNLPKIFISGGLMLILSALVGIVVKSGKKKTK